jgi:hypothetical protein
MNQELKENTVTIASAHQSAYLPWPGYFHKMALSDIFVILDNVQFEKNSFINRNKIGSANGPIWLTVPVKMAGHMQKKIMDMEIDNQKDWRKKHWRSIYYYYSRSPYFDRYSDFFEDLYKKEWLLLSDLINYTTGFFVNELDITTKLFYQSKIPVAGEKQSLILNLCRYFNAQVYIFGKLGKDYAQPEVFKEEGINIYFQDYKYPDCKNEIQNLSIIDLLFQIKKENLLEVIMRDNIKKSDIYKMVNKN